MCWEGLQLCGSDPGHLPRQAGGCGGRRAAGLDPCGPYWNRRERLDTARSHLSWPCQGSRGALIKEMSDPYRGLVFVFCRLMLKLMHLHGLRMMLQIPTWPRQKKGSPPDSRARLGGQRQHRG